jgi:membrane protein
VNIVERGLRSLDCVQQRHRVLAVIVAVAKKFGDDEAGAYAALLAYYGFFSLFPLLLVFVTVLGFALNGDPGLQQRILHPALGQSRSSATNCSTTSGPSVAAA